MFALNIPMRGTSMTAYSQADLSQPLSVQLTATHRQKTRGTNLTQQCADARGARQSI